MIKEFKLNKNVKLVVCDNYLNSCNSVMIKFNGGHSTEKSLELSHLTEHIVTCFNYLENGVEKPNFYLASMGADARTKDNFMEYTFSFLDAQSLKEKLNYLQLGINNVVINETQLEKEKQTILQELYHIGLSEDYIKQVDSQLKNVTPQDVYNYINCNLLANNMTICLVSSSKNIENFINIFNQFIKQIKTGNVATKNNKTFKIWQKYNDLNGTILKSPLDRQFTGSLVKLDCVPKTIKTEKEQLMADVLIAYIKNFCFGVKRVLRQEHHLVYRTNVWKEPSNFGIKAYCNSENVDEVAELLQSYLEDLKTGNISKQEFDTIIKDMQRKLFARPFISAYLQREMLNTYLNTKDVDADEKLQKEFLTKNNLTIQPTLEAEQIKENYSKIDYGEFIEFTKKYLKDVKSILKVEENQLKLN